MAFIRAGRIVDEYGTELPAEEFIQMALDWGQPDGLVANEDYLRKYERNIGNWQEYADQEIDGLRVSSSTEFC